MNYDRGICSNGSARRGISSNGSARRGISHNTALYLQNTLDGHKQVVKLFGEMTSTQIEDAMNIGIYNLNINTNPIEFITLCTTINDLFGPIVSAMSSFYYCVTLENTEYDEIRNQENIKLIASIILSHAYTLFDSVKLCAHWPKTAISEYLGYFEKLLS
jgi:hypothetical protein